ncbi:MAG: TorF family putative porin [Lysobacteraceae bacterium]
MTRKTLLVGALLAVLPTAAFAEGFNWNATIASDYLYRGIDQNDDQPALQLGAGYDFSNGFYVGAWGSNIDFGDDTDAEIDTFVGYRHELTDAAKLDVQVVRYNYVGEPNGTDYAYNELITKLGVGENLAFTVGYTNDYLNTDVNSWYSGVAGNWAIDDTYTLNANAGWTQIGGPLEDYFDYGVSVSRAVGPATVALGYVASSSNARDNFGRDLAEDKVLLTLGFGG